jgi:NADH dehydrogenase (ubiquinone) 1 alpha subcomplex subunit 2
MNVLVKAFKDHQVQEVRFLFCQKSATSAGLRNYLTKNFTTIKQQYPQLPLLVRESQGHDAVVIARFPYGKELGVRLEGQAEADVEKSIFTIFEQYKQEAAKRVI